jgi:hypothetical protein
MPENATYDAIVEVHGIMVSLFKTDQPVSTIVLECLIALGLVSGSMVSEHYTTAARVRIGLLIAHLLEEDAVAVFGDTTSYMPAFMDMLMARPDPIGFVQKAYREIAALNFFSDEAVIDQKRKAAEIARTLFNAASTQIARKKQQLAFVAESDPGLRSDLPRALGRFDTLQRAAELIANRHPQDMPLFVEQLLTPLLANDARTINFILASTTGRAIAMFINVLEHFESEHPITAQKFLFDYAIPLDVEDPAEVHAAMNKALRENPVLMSMLIAVAEKTPEERARHLEAALPDFIRFVASQNSLWNAARAHSYLEGLPIVFESLSRLPEDTLSDVVTAAWMIRPLWASPAGAWLKDILDRVDSVVIYEAHDEEILGMAGTTGHPQINPLGKDPLEIAAVIVHEGAHQYDEATRSHQVVVPGVEEPTIVVPKWNQQHEMSPYTLLTELSAHASEFRFMLDIWDTDGFEKSERGALVSILSGLNVMKTALTALDEWARAGLLNQAGLDWLSEMRDRYLSVRDRAHERIITESGKMGDDALDSEEPLDGGPGADWDQIAADMAALLPSPSDESGVDQFVAPRFAHALTQEHFDERRLEEALRKHDLSGKHGNGELDLLDLYGDLLRQGVPVQHMNDDFARVLSRYDHVALVIRSETDVERAGHLVTLGRNGQKFSLIARPELQAQIQSAMSGWEKALEQRAIVVEMRTGSFDESKAIVNGRLRVETVAQAVQAAWNGSASLAGGLLVLPAGLRWDPTGADDALQRLSIATWDEILPAVRLMPAEMLTNLRKTIALVAKQA